MNHKKNIPEITSIKTLRPTSKDIKRMDNSLEQILNTIDIKEIQSEINDGFNKNTREIQKLGRIITRVHKK